VTVHYTDGYTPYGPIAAANGLVWQWHVGSGDQLERSFRQQARYLADAVRERAACTCSSCNCRRTPKCARYPSFSQT
jgi:hypothetical protein